MLSVWVAGALCASAATLTSEDVIKMTQARLGDDVIIQTIKTTGSQFYLTPQEIKRLKARGVSSRVVAVMQNASYKSTGDVNGSSYQSASTNVVRGTYYYPRPPYDYYYYPPPPADGGSLCRSLLGFFFGPAPGPGPGWGHGPR